MTTSDQLISSVTSADIVQEALELLGVLGEGKFTQLPSIHLPLELLI